ncbi:MAG: hypothetical protein Q9191_000085 [Dirinaria sp. TL-2023a]
METINNADHVTLLRQGLNQASETLQGRGSEASKEANKNVAKDSDASLGTRAEAAKDAVGDKIDEQKHDVSLHSYPLPLLLLNWC